MGLNKNKLFSLLYAFWVFSKSMHTVDSLQGCVLCGVPKVV